MSVAKKTLTLPGILRHRQDGIKPRSGRWSLVGSTRCSSGIVYVDFLTQRRLLKDSAHWYRDVALANTLPAAG
jgi:hypothetical protein